MATDTDLHCHAIIPLVIEEWRAYKQDAAERKQHQELDTLIEQHTRTLEELRSGTILVYVQPYREASIHHRQ